MGEDNDLEYESKPSFWNQLLQLLSTPVSLRKSKGIELEDASCRLDESSSLKLLRESFKRVYKGDDKLRREFEIRTESKNLGMRLYEYRKLYELSEQKSTSLAQLFPTVSKLWKWSGISEKKGWDFAQLLISISIPIVLFWGSQYFTDQNNKRQQRIAEDNRHQDQKLAEDNHQDEILKNYFDSMRSLLLDKARPLRESKNGDESRSIARTLTLTTLRQLNGDLNGQRKGLVIQFLSESGLINKNQEGQPIVNLESADLSHADLTAAYLSGANLRGAKLISAKLINANLSDAILIDAYLSYANLRGINLKDADLKDADLKGVILWNRNLKGADLDQAKERAKKSIQSAKHWGEARYRLSMYGWLGLSSKPSKKL